MHGGCELFGEHCPLTVIEEELAGVFCLLDVVGDLEEGFLPCGGGDAVRGIGDVFEQSRAFLFECRQSLVRRRAARCFLCPCGGAMEQAEVPAVDGQRASLAFGRFLGDALEFFQEEHAFFRASGQHAVQDREDGARLPGAQGK